MPAKFPFIGPYLLGLRQKGHIAAMGPTCFAVLTALLSHVDQSWRTWVSIDKVAQEVGRSRRMVQIALHYLKSRHYITMQQRDWDKTAIIQILRSIPDKKRKYKSPYPAVPRAQSVAPPGRNILRTIVNQSTLSAATQQQGRRCKAKPANEALSVDQAKAAAALKSDPVKMKPHLANKTALLYLPAVIHEAIDRAKQRHKGTNTPFLVLKILSEDADEIQSELEAKAKAAADRAAEAKRKATEWEATRQQREQDERERIEKLKAKNLAKQSQAQTPRATISPDEVERRRKAALDQLAKVATRQK